MAQHTSHNVTHGYPYAAADIRIETGRSANGTFVCVSHLPSGQVRVQDGLQGERVQVVQRKLLALLHADVALPAQDIRISRGRGAQGHYLRVIHLPTQASRWQEAFAEEAYAAVEAQLLQQLERDVTRDT